MGVQVAARQTAPPQRADPQRSATHHTSGVACSAPSPIHRLQRAVGNRAMSSLLRKHIIQPKLTISHPYDESEREADRVADQVMRMADGQGPSALRIGNVSMLQRKCACGGGSDEPCSCDQETQALQRSAVSSEDVGSIPQSVPQVLRSFGRPMDAPTRNFMESRFGQDFSAVRVHTGGDAAASARSIKAHAYTVGNHVVFGANQYQPATDMGRRLLAHELTHVIQQGGKSGMVHRQPTKPAPAPNQPAPKPKFQSNVDCIVDKTNQHIPVAPNTVTVIQYGAEWCPPCAKEQAFLIELCNEYKAAKTAVPVRFFLVDVTDEDVKPTIKTWPPVPNSVPGLLIYSGQFQTAQHMGLTTPTKDEVKAEIDHAISCAKSPLKQCPPLEEPGGGTTGCKIDTSATPTGTRFKFGVNTVNFAPGEEAKLEAFVKKIKPKSTIDVLGLASSDGPSSSNKVLSCHRALVAVSVFARNGLIVNSMTGTGGVPGTDNKPEFRAVDIQVKDPSGPPPPGPPKTPTKTGECSAPTCVVDFVISGQSTIQKGRLTTDPKADPLDLKQTSDCNPSLYQIIPNPSNSKITSNTRILHVRWKKDPPPATRSVVRNAFDDVGDNPDPKAKAPSFAALDPTTSAGWATNVDSVSFRRQGCKTTIAAPAWCVPFCSFGKFTVNATVSWQCDDMACTNDFKTQPLDVDVKPKP